jgi:hypothetical protein
VFGMIFLLPIEKLQYQLNLLYLFLAQLIQAKEEIAHRRRALYLLAEIGFLDYRVHIAPPLSKLQNYYTTDFPLSQDSNKNT